MDTERAFLEALAEVRTWRVLGPHLELSDGAGRMLARFAARDVR